MRQAARFGRRLSTIRIAAVASRVVELQRIPRNALDDAAMKPRQLPIANALRRAFARASMRVSSIGGLGGAQIDPDVPQVLK
jgi:hypothetical protein